MAAQVLIYAMFVEMVLCTFLVRWPCFGFCLLKSQITGATIGGNGKHIYTLTVPQTERFLKVGQDTCICGACS